MKVENFNSWVAGFWEGEGCLVKLKRQIGYQTNINQAINNNRNVKNCMEKIQKKFKGHLYNLDNRGGLGSKLQIRWQLYKRKDIIYFLKTIYPYCQLRKREVRNALKHYKTHPKRINQYKECT